MVPDFDDEDDNQEEEPQSNMLTVPEKRSRDSVWSVLGGKLSKKYAGSRSLLSLDSENLERDGNQSDTWHGSSVSFLAGQDAESMQSPANQQQADDQADLAMPGNRG